MSGELEERAPDPVLAGFATGISWTIGASMLFVVLLFPVLWIYSVLPGPVLGLIVGLWRAYEAAGRAGGTTRQLIAATLAVLVALTVLVVPFVSWRIVVS